MKISGQNIDLAVPASQSRTDEKWTSSADSISCSSSASSVPSLLKYYAENDILSGRGGLVNKHLGNRVFRRLVQRNIRRYQDLTNDKPRQKLLIKSILESLRARGMRFLKQERDTSLWTEMSERDAWVKIKQTFREKDKPSLAKIAGNAQWNHTSDFEMLETPGLQALGKSEILVPQEAPCRISVEQFDSIESNVSKENDNRFDQPDSPCFGYSAPGMRQQGTSTAEEAAFECLNELSEPVKLKRKMQPVVALSSGQSIAKEVKHDATYCPPSKKEEQSTAILSSIEGPVSVSNVYLNPAGSERKIDANTKSRLRSLTKQESKIASLQTPRTWVGLYQDEDRMTLEKSATNRLCRRLGSDQTNAFPILSSADEQRIVFSLLFGEGQQVRQQEHDGCSGSSLHPCCFAVDANCDDSAPGPVVVRSHIPQHEAVCVASFSDFPVIFDDSWPFAESDPSDIPDCSGVQVSL